MSDGAGSVGKLNVSNLDIFCEIGNIGAGNAATSLAEMLGRRVDMGVPVASLVKFDDVTNILGGPENLVAGVMISMSGDLRGYILLVLDETDAARLLGLLMGTAPTEGMLSLTELDISTLTEVANILVGSYLSAIGQMTGLTIVPSVPDLAMDMAGAIMSVPVIEYGKAGDEVLLLETAFYNNDETIAGHFFIVPDLESYATMLKSLGVE